MRNWMKVLATHYDQIRWQYPQDKLMIIFDIDGTIVDMRYMIRYVLQAFDRNYRTSFFSHLQISDITVHENQVEHLLVQQKIAPHYREKILAWYKEHRWSSEAILSSHQPFHGVLEVIRWFQIQPNTEVGLNTGRPESLRADTLRSLNALGKAYRVQFTSAQLYMNPADWEQGVVRAKVEGVQYFQRAGYRIFAVVDNEPENLRAISQIDPSQQILLLHFSISWHTPNMRQFFDQMDRWGFAVNIYNVPDLEAFLQAVLLLPQSITSDFNFPQWHYYGRGSGENGNHYEYAMRQHRRNRNRGHP